jgi:LuxR family maltose regulon positive regulatory protein
LANYGTAEQQVSGAVTEDQETTTQSAGGVLVVTKVFVPAPRPGIVRRAELVTRLAESGEARLVLLDAPAGAGKTTLLSEWHSSPEETRPFAWVSLDPGDNDPVRFWVYVIEALRTVEPSFGDEPLAALQPRRDVLIDVVLPLLLNELARLPLRLVLVLDDYHVIRDGTIHESVAFFVDHLPANVQVAIATRSDPPLDLPRLRARGQMVEVRATDLRFSLAEASALLRVALGLDLDTACVIRLLERTEGWAAGLYLAALSLRGRRDLSEVIDSFAGDDRHVVDYLASEVLEGQPEEVRAFLLRTSILELLSGPLCDAVARVEGSAARLRELERSNLFLVPLDSRRECYRYHHLFGELLQHELIRTHPDEAVELHRRASKWHRQAGSIPEAIRHAVTAGDIVEAAELVARHWNRFFNMGELETVTGWLDALPLGVVTADARLSIARAWLAMDAGRLTEVEEWIAAAEKGLESGSPSDADGSLRCETAVLHAVHRFKAGAVEEARVAALRVLDLEPPESSFAWTVANLILGITLHWSERAAEAIPVLRRASDLARTGANDLARTYAHGYLALAHAALGQWEAAAEAAEVAVSASDRPGVSEHFVAMVGHLATAAVRFRRGEFHEAEASAARASELSARGAGRIEVAASALTLARVRQALGDEAAARRLRQRADAVLEACLDPGTVVRKEVGIELRPRPTGRRSGAGGPRSEELTDRELAVLRLLGTDLSQREMGAALYVSMNTIKTHTREIYRKLGVSNRGEALARARDIGLI